MAAVPRKRERISARWPGPGPVLSARLLLPVMVRPRGEPYTGPVALLIDTWNMSAAETLIATLSDAGRVTTVGRRTASSSGNPIACRLPGCGVARYPAASFVRADGLPIEGIGLEPDVPVALALADLWAGVDGDVRAAEAFVLDMN